LNVYVSRALQSQRRVLANQILIRKASRQLAEAQTLEGSWQVLVGTLDALDFDAVECQFERWPKGSVPCLSGWSRGGEVSSSDYWSVSIPLHAGEEVLGELQVWRALSKDRMLFQFSSLLDTLIPPFEKQLKKRYDAQVKRPADELSVRPNPTLEPSLLASGRKG